MVVIPNPGVNHLASQDTQPGQSGEQSVQGQGLPSQAVVSQVGSLVDMFGTQLPVKLPGLETFSKPARVRKEHKRECMMTKINLYKLVMSVVSWRKEKL